MRLRSTQAQTVRVAALDLVVEFAAGEEMRTEISAKFRRERFDASMEAAGLRVDQWWTDRDHDFVLSLVRPAL
jgi:L-histidine Nalpha-methyltransferase